MKQLLSLLSTIGLLLPATASADMVCSYNSAGCLISRAEQSSQSKAAKASALSNTTVLPRPYIDDKITIESDWVDAGISVEYVVCDFNGHVWHSGHIEYAATTIATYSFPAGTYILMITNGAEQVSYKLIKQ